jgi:hypothetical protein
MLFRAEIETRSGLGTIDVVRYELRKKPCCESRVVRPVSRERDGAFHDAGRDDAGKDGSDLLILLEAHIHRFAAP